MRALSVRQPWAWALIYGVKDIENRSWWTSYRGTILIHASANIGSKREFHSAVEAIADIDEIDFYKLRDQHLDVVEDRRLGFIWRPRSSLRRGGIIGKAVLDGIGRERFELQQSGADLRWWNERERAFGWVFRDRKPLPFMPLKGAQGLFDVPQTLIAHETTLVGGAHG